MYEIIGFRRAQYSIDGSTFVGFQVSFCIPMTMQDDSGQGVDVFSFFINSAKFADFVPQLHDCYDLYFSYFNGKRKIAGMHKV